MNLETAYYIFNKNNKLFMQLTEKIDIELAHKHTAGFFEGTVIEEHLIRVMYYIEINKRLLIENEELLKIINGENI